MSGSGNITPEKSAYRRNHRRIAREMGLARERQCAIGNDHLARDWAQTHDTDGTSNEHFRPMCRLHHNQYDQPQRTAGVRNMSEESKRKASARMIELNRSKEQRARDSERARSRTRMPGGWA